MQAPLISGMDSLIQEPKRQHSLQREDKGICPLTWVHEGKSTYTFNNNISTLNVIFKTLINHIIYSKVNYSFANVRLRLGT